MDPGSSLAVISLAVQLATTVQSVTEYLRTIHDAPSDLLALIETLDLMQSNLNQVRYLLEQQFSDKRFTGSPVFILNALQTCDKRVQMLSKVVDEVRGQLRNRRLMKRTWASLNVRKERTRVQELRSQLHDSMAGLQLAVANNIWQLQLNQVPLAISQEMVVTNQVRTPLLAKEVTQQSAILNKPQSQERALDCGLSSLLCPMSTRLVNSVWYHGLFGSVTLKEKFIRVRSSSSRSIRNFPATDKVMALRISLLRREVEIYFGTGLASIPRALRVYPIVESFDRSIKSMCHKGDLEGIQEGIANGSIYPYATDQYGWTLLNVAATYSQPELCLFLLRLGLDPDRVSSPGSLKAMLHPMLPFRYSHFRVLDTVKILAQAQQELSRTDISEFFENYKGPSDTADWMLSQYAVRYELTSTEQEEEMYHPLGTALREFVRQEDQAGWKLLIRRLIRTGVDIHAPMPRGLWFDPQDHQYVLSQHGTPLDELFTYIHTPWEAKVAADAWLQILSSEGYDIRAYLEKEKSLHATRPPIASPHRFHAQTPKELVFDMGENPSVYAERWIDPESSAFLLRQDFKQSNVLRSFYDWEAEDTWPIIYPKGSLYGAESAISLALANRRWGKKARKEIRRKCTLASSKMPGAWPGQ